MEHWAPNTFTDRIPQFEFLPSAMPFTRYTEEMQRELDEVLEVCNNEEGHLLRHYRAY